jgi:hypothetical protein
MAKEPTPKQLEARKKFAEAAKARSEAAKNKNPQTNQEQTEATAQTSGQQMVEIPADVLQSIMQRLQAVENQTPPPVNQHLTQPQTVQIGVNGQTIGVFTKYPIDPSYYPDPTPALYQEPALSRFAVAQNFRFTWEVEGQTYETKFGTNVREPLFTVKMYRLDFDENGNPKPTGFLLRRLKLTEDEATMNKIATELGLDIQNIATKDLLDVARYHRIRQWVMDYFYPPSFEAQNDTNEMVDPISGRVIPVENIQKIL